MFSLLTKTEPHSGTNSCLLFTEAEPHFWYLTTPVCYSQKLNPTSGTQLLPTIYHGTTNQFK